MRKIATAAVVLACCTPACFALFSLDDYGPPDDVALVDAAVDTTVIDASLTDASDAKAPPGRKVFVTRATFTGQLGGLDGGDGRCMASAAAAGLAGSYGAWLSDETTSVAARLDSDAGPLRLLNGKLVAANVIELAASGPRIAIDIDERGTPVDAGGGCDDGGLLAWTGTYDDGGTGGGTFDCSRWRTMGNGSNGLVGIVGAGAKDWSASCQRTCDMRAALYCIER